MINKPKPNRAICSGDNYAKTNPRSSDTLTGVLKRMEEYDIDFLYKIQRENRNPIWRNAAQIAIDERIAGIPRTNPSTHEKEVSIGNPKEQPNGCEMTPEPTDLRGEEVHDIPAPDEGLSHANGTGSTRKRA